MKNWLKNLIVAVTGLAAGILVAEIGVRAFSRTYSPIAFDIYYRDAEGQLRMKPHAVRQHAHPEWNVQVRINGEGFRDIEQPPRTTG